MKSLDSATLLALGQPGVQLVLFLQFEYVIDGEDFTSYLCTATNDIYWGAGQPWIGGGGVLSIAPIREVGSVEAVGVQVTLSGVPTAMVSLVLQAHCVGRPAKIYIGAYNDAGALVSTPWLEFEGRLDNLELQDNGDTSRVQLSIESKLVILQKAEDRLWTDAEQRKLKSTDEGLKFANATVERTLAWGPRR